jgi:hypothetical protein
MLDADPNNNAGRDVDDLAAIADLAAQAEHHQARGTATEQETGFRHGAWRPLRERIRKMLARAGTSERVLERFDACGSYARVYWNAGDERYTTRASYCKNRHCRPCMQAKGANMARNLRRHLGKRPAGRYRFITLTLKHDARPLADQLRHLMKSYGQLRRHAVFGTQRGGAYFLEVKIGDDGQWHPHLHLITEGYFLPRQELSDAWHKVTGGSFVTDVRGLRDEKRVVFEVTKYVAKGTSRDVWDDDDRALEWIHAAAGVRMCGTFGTWRLFKITAASQDKPELVYICTLTELMTAAAGGDNEATHILLCLRAGRPPPGSIDSNVPFTVRSES